MPTKLSTKDDIRLIRFIISYLKARKYAPNRREIMRALDLRSTSPVQVRMNRLVDLGWIEISKDIARGIRVTRVGIGAIRAWEEQIDTSISEWREHHSENEQVQDH